MLCVLGGSGVCQTFINAVFLCICLVDDRKKFIYRCCVFQAFRKCFIHQEYGQLAEHIQVDVVLGIRCCDQKDQVHRLAVQRIKVYTVFYNHCCQPRFAHCITFSVRDRDPFTDAGGAFFFSCINLLAVAFRVIDLSAFYHQGYHLIQCFLFATRCTVQTNAALVQ